MAYTRSATTSTSSQQTLPAQEQQHQDLDLGALAMVAGGLLSPTANLAMQTLGGNDMVRSMLGLGPKEPPRSPEDTTNPFERLSRWQAEQRALAEATVDDETLADPQRKATAASTLDEVDEEAARLYDQAMAGEPLTLDQVDALIARKAQESAIESAHGVNLTHAPASWWASLMGDEAADADRAFWSTEDLVDLEEDLSQLSDGLLPANGITELRRVNAIEESPTSKGGRDGQALQVTDAATGGQIGSTVLQHLGKAIFQNQGLGPPEQAEDFGRWLMLSALERGAHELALRDDPQSTLQTADDNYWAAQEGLANPSSTDPADLVVLQAHVKATKEARDEARRQRDAKAQQAEILESSLNPEQP